MRIIMVAFVALWLAGCMSMPISTMVKMATFSIYDVESKEMRIAVRTDRTVFVEAGAVNMSMSYETEGGKGLPPVSIKHKFKFVRQPDIKLDYTDILRDGIEDFEALTIFKLSDEDAKQFDDLLQTAKQYKEAEVEGKGNFGIGLENHCFGDISQKEELLVDIFLKTRGSEDYILFLDDIDVLEQANERNIDLKEVNQCGPA